MEYRTLIVSVPFFSAPFMEKKTNDQIILEQIIKDRCEES
jgi:hypothetical protein